MSPKVPTGTRARGPPTGTRDQSKGPWGQRCQRGPEQGSMGAKVPKGPKGKGPSGGQGPKVPAGARARVHGPKGPKRSQRGPEQGSKGPKGPNDPRFHPWAQRAQRSQRGPEQGSNGPKGPRAGPWAQRAQRSQRGPEQGSKGPKVPTGTGPWVQRAERAPRVLAKGPAHRDQRKETGKGPNGDRGALRSPEPRVHGPKVPTGTRAKGPPTGTRDQSKGPCRWGAVKNYAAFYTEISVSGMSLRYTCII